MSVPEDLREAIRQHYSAEDVKLMASDAGSGEQVYAYGMLPDSTIMGWYSLGDLDELEKELKARGEL